MEINKDLNNAEIKAIFKKTEIVLLCRETTNTGDNVYIVDENANIYDLPIKELKLRECFNLDLKYFVMFKSAYDNESTREYVLNLIKKDIPSDLYTYI